MTKLAYNDALQMACQGCIVGLVAIKSTQEGVSTLFSAGFRPEFWMLFQPAEIVALMAVLNTRRSAEEAGCQLV